MDQATNSRWPCQVCGANMRFDPAQGLLVCSHCGNTSPMPETSEIDRSTLLVEHDLAQALANQLPAIAMEEVRVSRCAGCGAELELDMKVKATTCPYCATPVMTEGVPQRLIRPQGVVPFAITEAQARESLRKWLGSLWLAPNDLQAYARKGRSMTGMYVPFWTYDADTHSRYQGQRGDAYYVTETVTVMVDGKPRQEQRQVRKIRWTRVHGRVARQFDDIMILASRSLPRDHAEALQPWDISAIAPPRPDYMSGFQAEAYSVELAEGHVQACQIMSSQIALDVRRDIGGDEQRVEDIDTTWSNETFKHILLPIWAAAYRYGGRSYGYVVNGQTGKVKGERPWSKWKIAGLVLLVLAIVGLIAAVNQSR